MCICMYIWMYMCGVCVCVRGWVTKEEISYPASLKRHRSFQKTFLCLYWREDHSKNCARENLQDRKRRTKDVCQSGAEGQSVRSGSPKQSIRSGTLKQSIRSETQKWRVRHSELGTCGWTVKNEETEQ